MEGDRSQPESLAGSRCIVRVACEEDSWGGVMRLHLAVGTGPGLLSSPQLLTSEGLIGKAMSPRCECVTETGVEAASAGRGRAGRKAARTGWPRARHGRGHEEGGLAPQPPGPQGQAIGIISLGRRRLWDKACISKTLGRAPTQAWRVRVTPTSILASLLPFCSKFMLKSQWASQGGCQSHLESEPLCFLRAPWAHLGSLPEGALHSCYGLGHRAVGGGVPQAHSAGAPGLQGDSSQTSV